jgi:hypothetical protein
VRALGALAFVSLLGTALAACGAPGEFLSSYTPSSSAIAGRSWRAPYFLDTAALPLKAYAQPLLFASWDAAASVSAYGTRIQLAATWLDPLTGLYRGGIRLFDESRGWASPGLASGTLAIDTASFGFPSVAAGPKGSFLVTFFGAAAGRSLSASFAPSSAGGAWTASSLNTGLSSYPDFSAAQARGAGPYVRTAMDDAGAGYVFFSGATGAGPLYLSTWSSSSSTGISTSLQAASGGASLQARSGLTALNDGGGQVCYTFETASASLQAACIASSSGTLGALSTVSSGLVAGHEVAADGAGGLMAVFYQQSGSAYRVYASLRSGGAWSSPTQIDSLMPTGYAAPPPTGSGAIPGARPGVAYVGSCKYLAVWVGVNTVGASTQLFYSAYDPASGWAAAQGVPGTLEAYLTIPHAQALAVFGNGDGNAGFALNHIHATEAIGGVAATLPTYLESDQVRNIKAARWQTQVGWLPVTTMGNLCYIYGAGNTATNPQCTHRPQGFVLASGRTLVFYADRDDYTGSLISGNVRIAVGEFR